MNGRSTAIHFDIQMSEPYTYTSSLISEVGKQHQGMRNVCLDVITTTAQRAIELALKRHPEAQVHVVQRRGGTNLLFDPEIVRELLEDE